MTKGKVYFISYLQSWISQVLTYVGSEWGEKAIAGSHPNTDGKLQVMRLLLFWFKEKSGWINVFQLFSWIKYISTSPVS